MSCGDAVQLAQQAGLIAAVLVQQFAVLSDLRRPLHSDGSMSEGPTSWGYQLVKDSEGAWRIFGEGVA